MVILSGIKGMTPTTEAGPYSVQTIGKAGFQEAVMVIVIALNLQCQTLLCLLLLSISYA